ncbi:ion transporter [Ancylothrix sp. C2]|uniref:ion transporter n=1 Tax=Ancylothrix sp. D3o TaxID=2953691 RepID=UPI0021BA6338|nr:ion transporter [Ancylothrix sp. D3o]MCT7951646.1 ion transporter [Ancylothrix sp. D3o]
MSHQTTSEKSTLKQERWEVLEQLEDWLETPMFLLGFAWLALLGIDLIFGLNPFLETISNLIWILFIVDFIVKFTLAPNKLSYLRANWLTAFSLLLPALRLFRAVRVFQILRAARGLRLVRVISSLNRGMRTLRASMSRRGFGYVIALTLVVTLIGSAGMYAFEKDTTEGFKDYGTALWWTAMVMTTMGSESWPKTAEGRVLCLVLSLYGFAVFGYVTAALATFFVGRDAEDEQAEVAGAKALAALHQEITAMRAEIQVLLQQKSDA